jgi:aspartate oxidase
MLEKLLRARLPEQIVALIEKLEQDPDASHLYKVERLVNDDEAIFTRHERWALKRAMRKCQNVIRREETLNRVMRVVINEQPEEKKIDARYIYNQGIQGAGMSLQQHGALHQQQVQQAQLAAQQARNMGSQGYYTDARSLYNGTRL